MWWPVVLIPSLVAAGVGGVVPSRELRETVLPSLGALPRSTGCSGKYSTAAAWPASPAAAARRPTTSSWGRRSRARARCTMVGGMGCRPVAPGALMRAITSAPPTTCPSCARAAGRAPDGCPAAPGDDAADARALPGLRRARAGRHWDAVTRERGPRRAADPPLASSPRRRSRRCARSATVLMPRTPSRASRCSRLVDDSCRRRARRLPVRRHARGPRDLAAGARGLDEPPPERTDARSRSPSSGRSRRRVRAGRLTGVPWDDLDRPRARGRW